MEKTLTLRSVIWSAIVRAAARATLRGTIRATCKGFGAGILSAVATSPETASANFEAIMSWRNHTVPAVLWSLLLVFALPRLVSLVRERRAPGAALEGIPTRELVAHLCRAKTLRRDDVEARWGTPRYRYTALVKKLKEIGVLTHGVNNTTVLAEGWGRAELEKLFDGKEDAADLEKGIEIVRPLPSPTLFTKRPVSA